MEKIFSKQSMSYVIFALFFILITININQDFKSLHEGNGIVYYSAACAHLHWGLKYTKGIDHILRKWNNKSDIELFLSPADTITAIKQNLKKDHFQHYNHHPPGLGLTIALFTSVFGHHYWSIRLVPILFSLLSFWFFYLILKHLKFNLFQINLMLFFFALFPMTTYFGRHINHEAPVLFCGLLFLYNYLHFSASKKPVYFILQFISIILGAFYGWPVFFIVGIVILSSFIRHFKADKKFWLKMLYLGIFSGILFLLVIFHLYKSDLKNVFTIFLSRADILEKNYGIIEWSARTISHFAFTFSNILFYFLIVIFTISLFKISYFKQLIIKNKDKSMLFIILFLWGISHVLIFRDGSYIHNYWLFYLIPSIAMISGYYIYKLYSLIKFKVIASSIMILIVGAFLFESLLTLFHLHHINYAANFGTYVLFINLQDILMYVKKII
ncbi:MAG: glycosyltransferase family 39 protein [Spirochaetes bacterium]|nr:glycosyltransferase family 39 protein [Spirochaetota bacterium]